MFSLPVGLASVMRDKLIFPDSPSIQDDPQRHLSQRHQEAIQSSVQDMQVVVRVSQAFPLKAES
jgi:GTPase Era involved in 16S rRNA processing